MILFSLPIILQGSFQIIYNLTDRFWVALLPEGKDAIGSVSVGFPVFFFMLSLVFGIAMGAGIMIAQYRGAQDKKMVNLTTRNFMAVGSIMIVAISVIMLFATEFVLDKLMHTPVDMLEDAVGYMRWMFIGFIVMYTFNALTGVFRGLGDSTTPLKVAAIVMIINIVIDPIFILDPGSITLPSGASFNYPGLGLGVVGAAQATLVAYMIGSFILFKNITRYREWVNLSPVGFSFNLPIIKDLLRIGLPTGATMVIVSVSLMIIMRFVNDIDPEEGIATAAFGVCIILDGLLMMPAQSFSQSMSTIAGQNIGAGKWDRVDKFLISTIAVSLGVAVVVGGLLVLNIGPVSKVYLPQEGDYDVVFPLIRIYFQIMIIRFIMMAMFFPIVGTIRGAGDTMMAMFLVMFTQLLIRIPVTWLSQVYGYGFTGIAFGLAFSTIFGFLIVLIYYKTGRWKRFALIKNNHSVPDSKPDDDIRPGHM